MKILGHVVSGSLADGFDINITTGHDEMRAGKFVSIISHQGRFFSLVTDLKLAVSNTDIFKFNASTFGPFQLALAQKTTYSMAHLRPLILVDNHNAIRSVKTVPNHFSAVTDVDNSDIKLIFGSEEHVSKNYFAIGCPLGMTESVCLNLEKLCERSNGIFGKTGTGKTFLTRLVLAGIVSRKKAVNLIFDMHSEYGIQARKENSVNFVKGLKTLFPERVALFALDPNSTRRRGSSPDVEVVISYQDISVEDILSMQNELNLHATALEAAYMIEAKYKKEWLSVLLSSGDDLRAFAGGLGANYESIAALFRKLKRIEKLPFFCPQKTSSSVIDQMMEYIDKGIHIIVEFGNFTSTFCYLLVANIITRRIHTEYMNKTEKFLGSHNLADEPKKLLITIEEAHKFLNPIAAKQTIFGIIAREMRKYYVSILIVDQRPSGIDAELMSQIGTKIVAQLNDEHDIQAVLNGVAGAQELRTVLSTLESKKQVLLLGHAVPMPVVVESREYGEQFYQDLFKHEPGRHRSIDNLINDIF
jgi:DNA helicase HerA-like ATPase